MTSAMRRLWLTAGWLLVAYVVLTFAGTFGDNTTIGDSKAHATNALITSSMTKTFVGGYIEFIATLVFLAAAMLVARLLRGTGELPGWLSSTIGAAAMVYAGVEIACAAAGAAAVYNGHHGASLAVVTAVNDIRNVGFSLSGGVAGLLVLATAGAGQATKLLPRWFSVAGYVVGVLLIAGVPLAKTGAPQVLLWFLWLLTLGIIALRAARRQSAPVATGYAVSA
jgi:hypothetical protein